MFRSGVSTTAPEGLRWTAIPTPSGSEVSQITVGSTGLVWACLYNGRAIVRTKITKDSLTGESWLEVKPPGNGLKIIQVSVGMNAVWCVTNDYHIWFRRGVKGEIAGISEDAAIGSGWVEMVGNMSNVSVAGNDQVFAIGSEDRGLYFRSGVTGSDLTGKQWRQIQCPMQMSRTSSEASFNSRASGSQSPSGKHRSLGSLAKPPNPLEHVSALDDDEEQSRSAPTVNLKHKPELWKKPINPRGNSLVEAANEKAEEELAVVGGMASSAPVFEVSGKHFETPLRNPRAWSPVRSVGSIVGCEAHPESDSVVFDADHSRDSGVFGGEEDDNCGSQFWTDSDVLWTCCTAGAVTVDPNQLPNWFNDTLHSNSELELTQQWRIDILSRLKSRLAHLPADFDPDKYEKAVELSSWVKTGEVKMSRPSTGSQFEECLIQLEWVSSSGSGLDSGTFTILTPDGQKTKIQFSLSEITCVMGASDPGLPRIAIHVPRLPTGSSPIRIQFSGDTDLEDWLAHLTSVCCQMNEVQGSPSDNSIWMTSTLGDVFAFDSCNLKAVQWNSGTNQYLQNVAVSAADTPYEFVMSNG